MAGGPSETAGSIVTVTPKRPEIPVPGATFDPTASAADFNPQQMREEKNPAANIEISQTTWFQSPRQLPT